MLSSRRGDTLIEVLFSITIFSIVAVITINLMNNGISTAQKTLEVTMARNEIDAQAEALRFIQNSYLAEREFGSGDKQFSALWTRLTNNASLPQGDVAQLLAGINDISRCSEIYDGFTNAAGAPVRPLRTLFAFTLNTRLIQPRLPDFHYYDNAGSVTYEQLLNEMVIFANGSTKLKPTVLYPRIVYDNWGSAFVYDPNSNEPPSLKEQERLRRIAAAEGIWVIAVKGDTMGTLREPDFFDFHIRTCWHSVGRMAPSTIGTIVRLYNPDAIEGNIGL